MKKFTALLTAALLTLGLLAGCGGSPAASGSAPAAPSAPAASSAPTAGGGEKPLAGKELTVAMSANYKYFETVTVGEDGKEKYVGLDLDILDYMAEDLGFTYTISNMPFASLVGSLQASQADLVISGMSYTEERAQSVDFSIPYANAKVGCLVRKDAGISSVADLAGQPVACSAGTNYENIVKKIDGAELKTFDGQAAVTQELVVGRVNAAITGATACRSICEENEGLDYFIIDPSEMDLGSLSTYNMAFPQGSELVAVFDAEIEKMQENGKLDEILANWLGEDYVK